jgi:transposase
MPRRHELTDDQWAVVEPHMPPRSRGRAWADHRRTVNGVMYWAATGVQWRDLPERYGPWQTVYERFRRWRDDGTWAAVLRALRGRADELGLIDWSLFCVDTTVARATRSAAGAAKKGGRRPSRRATPSASGGAASGRNSTWFRAGTPSRSGPP